MKIVNVSNWSLTHALSPFQIAYSATDVVSMPEPKNEDDDDESGADIDIDAI